MKMGLNEGEEKRDFLTGQREYSGEESILFEPVREFGRALEVWLGSWQLKQKSGASDKANGQ